MNCTLKQLQDRVNKLIAQQGEDAHCAALIYTKYDCRWKNEDGEFDYDNNIEDSEVIERVSEVIERVFDDIGNNEYIYQVIQECIDGITEKEVMLQQQELV